MFEGLPHFWINRAIDAQRRALAQDFLARAGIAHERVDAVTPETLPPVSVRKPFANSLAEVAITASHLRAVGAAYASGSAAALIMEDDVRSHYLFDGAALLASAPPDWEVLQLHVSHAPVVLELGELYLKHGVLWHEWEPSCYSAGAYVVSRPGMERLLARYCPDGVALDLSAVHAHGKLVADHLLYRRSVTYTATVPYCSNDVALASTHAPQRDASHHRPGALGVESVRRRIVQQFGDKAGAAGGGAPYPFALRTL